MKEYFEQLPEEVRVLILKIAVIAGAGIILGIVLAVIMRRIRASGSQLEKMKEQTQAHEIDTLRTAAFTRSDLHFWIKSNMKKGAHCVLMTGEAAKDKDRDLAIPSADGGQVLCLCILYPGRQKVIKRRFVIAGSIDPELDDLLKEHNGSVVFED